MASEQAQTCITLPAETTLSTFQYRAVKVADPGVIALSTGSADVTIGILQNKPAGSCEAKVCIEGHTKVITGATVSVGDYLQVHSAGGVRTIVASPLTRVLGIALTRSSGTGEYIEMLMERWVYPLL